MNIMILAVATPPPDIYHGISICKTFREDKFTPVDITRFGGCNVRKHREIKNVER